MGGPDGGSSLARLWQREMVMACGEAEVDGTASSSGGVWSGEGLRWWEASPVAGAPRRVASKLGRAADKNVLTHRLIIINLHLISNQQQKILNARTDICHFHETYCYYACSER